VAVAGGSVAALELLDAVRRRVAVVTRIRPDARLLAPPPPRTPRTIGRPRLVGVRLPTLARRLVGVRLPTLARRLGDRRTRRRHHVVAGWYGGGDRRGELCSGTALWHHPGVPVVPLRRVLVRDPPGGFRPQALLRTDLETEPAQILSRFVRRWATEGTFAGVRRHLGVETQRRWSDLAIARTTPAPLGPYSLVTLWADDGLNRGSVVLPRAAAWCPKRTATFSDALATARRAIWAHEASRASAPTGEAEKVPRAVLQRLTDPACYAA
jgi:hypothetical protein